MDISLLDDDEFSDLSSLPVFTDGTVVLELPRFVGRELDNGGITRFGDRNFYS